MIRLSTLIIRIGRKLVHLGHKHQTLSYTNQVLATSRRRAKLEAKRAEQAKLQASKMDALTKALARQQEIADRIDQDQVESINKCSAQLGALRHAANSALDEQLKVQRVLAA